MFLAELVKMELCNDPGVLSAFKILGIVIDIIKVLVPVVIVITGIISLSKAVISADDGEIKKSTMALIKKTIISLIIVCIPTIFYAGFKLIDKYNEDKFQGCITCLDDDSTCQTKIISACGLSGNKNPVCQK